MTGIFCRSCRPRSGDCKADRHSGPCRRCSVAPKILVRRLVGWFGESARWNSLKPVLTKRGRRVNQTYQGRSRSQQTHSSPLSHRQNNLAPQKATRQAQATNYVTGERPAGRASKVYLFRIGLSVRGWQGRLAGAWRSTRRGEQICGRNKGRLRDRMREQDMQAQRVLTSACA